MQSDQKRDYLLEALNHPDINERLLALQNLKKTISSNELCAPRRDVNNHIHTSYSFSPYSPAKAVWMACQAGLSTAGIIDHDSVSGVREFIRAGEIMDLPVTIGAEFRASFSGMPFAERRLNNPDQSGIAYLTFHGIPHSQIDAVSDVFAPIGRARDKRNRVMTQKLGEIVAPVGIELLYDRDVLPLSMQKEGGSVTERHILFALAGKILEKYKPGMPLLAFLTETLQMQISAKVQDMLLDPGNPFIKYDLLGALKSDLVEKFYIPATDECPPVQDAVKFADENGIILAYPYLGDVGDSATGDKKTQTFEDSYLPELFAALKEMGFHGITYMPSRNTREQLIRLRELCDQYGFFQISGEDINQPRQSFICKAMQDRYFANLYDAAWALIGSERLSGENPEMGMFSPTMKEKYPELAQRVEFFKNAALKIYQKNS